MSKIEKSLNWAKKNRRKSDDGAKAKPKLPLRAETKLRKRPPGENLGEKWIESLRVEKVLEPDAENPESRVILSESQD